MVGIRLAQSTRIRPLVAASLGPIFEAVRQHDDVGLALNGKLHLADWTNHPPSDAALPVPPILGRTPAQHIAQAAMHT
jgi:hypothetical protein